MNAIPRSARLSSTAQVVAILVASAAIWIAIIAAVATLFLTVFIPAVTLGGKGEIPSDFPVYPGAQLQTATAFTDSRCTTVTATWSVNASAETVVTFYQSRLADGPWGLTDTRQHVGAIDLSFASTSDPHREGVLTISSEPVEPSTTLISLELAKTRPGAVASCSVLTGRVG